MTCEAAYIDWKLHALFLSVCLALPVVCREMTELFIIVTNMF